MSSASDRYHPPVDGSWGPLSTSGKHVPPRSQEWNYDVAAILLLPLAAVRCLAPNQGSLSSAVEADPLDERSFGGSIPIKPHRCAGLELVILGQELRLEFFGRGLGRVLACSVQRFVIDTLVFSIKIASVAGWAPGGIATPASTKELSVPKVGPRIAPPTTLAITR
mgnify:CR=1 FL=1